MTARLRLFPAAAGILAVAWSMPPAPPAAANQPAPERRLAAPTPEAVRGSGEEVAGDRFGPVALVQARAAGSSVIAVAVPGRFNDGGPRVNIAIRSGRGWSAWTSGRAAPLAPEVGAEIDRLLASRAFAAEPDRFPAMDCPDSGASLLLIRHGGRVRATRQSCMPANFVGRLLLTVLEERVQPAG